MQINVSIIILNSTLILLMLLLVAHFVLVKIILHEEYLSIFRPPLEAR